MRKICPFIVPWPLAMIAPKRLRNSLTMTPESMPRGGQLTISAHRENGAIVAEVQDQGGGIPKEMHDKVFELYFTTKKEGSGIGLAQTYQILQWHYGTVDFESVETSGTIFRFQIPASGADTGRKQGVNQGAGALG